jgi:uncharacterized protein YdiU (UPF0061 family)
MARNRIETLGNNRARVDVDLHRGVLSPYAQGEVPRSATFMPRNLVVLTMLQRLGLRKVDPENKTLIENLLELMQAHEVDFHSTFRTLSFFRPVGDTAEPASDAEFIKKLDESVVDSMDAAAAAWKTWLSDYSTRILQDASEWATEGQKDWLQARENVMKLVNPRFVLRQWILEEVIAKCEEGDITQSRDILAKMLEVSNLRSWSCTDAFELG